MALICMTGLAIYLISDLVSYASNSDNKDAGMDLDLKGSESGILSKASNNIDANSSLNMSLQTREQSPANLSKINSSLQSGQTAKVIAATGKTPISRSSGSKHRSSSSTKSSSANSAKTSANTSNLTNETTTAAAIPANETATAAVISANETATAAAILANETETSAVMPENEKETAAVMPENAPLVQASTDSQGADAAAPAAPATMASGSIGNLANPAGKTNAREPTSTIAFKTKTNDGASVSDSTDKAKSSKPATKSINFKTTRAKSIATRKSKTTDTSDTSQSSKVNEAKEKMKAKRDRIEQDMKKKADQMRSRAR